MKAVVLLMIGSVFYAFGGVAAEMLAKTSTGPTRSPGMDVTLEPNWAAITALAIGVVCGAAIVIGALLTYTGVKRNIRLGSIISIMFSIAGISNTVGGGLFVGLGLVLAGNVLSLVWKPKELPPQPTSAP
jgi:hypothetical protein